LTGADFFLPPNYQAECGVHKASSLMDIWGSFPRIRWPVHETDHPPPTCDDSNNECSYNFASPTYAMCRDIFALTWPAY